MTEILDLLQDKRTAAREGPDPAATARQHKKGKLTARERIERLLERRAPGERGDRRRR
ncbi:MAG TPA: hypothetical protein VJT49_19790 [Amycolatopsis sp.]|uniref:hypothetical protein n=1 Tax=Amycolatopsis sp. TaxID=37632 RepID=UPI002B480A27|nr:hypothetical protein [Amycolatopsis sp.]HKS47308.1 hypothetical protein [Amycolatopsis sp.]